MNKHLSDSITYNHALALTYSKYIISELGYELTPDQVINLVTIYKSIKKYISCEEPISTNVDDIIYNDSLPMETYESVICAYVDNGISAAIKETIQYYTVKTVNKDMNFWDTLFCNDVMHNIFSNQSEHLDNSDLINIKSVLY